MHLKKAVLGTAMAMATCAISSLAYATPSFVLTSTPDTGQIIDIKYEGYLAANPGVSLTPAGSSNGYETTWGIGYITTIDNHSSNAQIWVGNGNNSQNTSVDFLLYGIADQLHTPGNPNVINNVGCTVNPGCDGKIHIDFYMNNGTDPGRTATAADRTGFSTFSGITNNQLLMQWVLVPGDLNNTGDGTTTLVQYRASDQPNSGSGTFLANCINGSGCALLAHNQEALNGLTSYVGDILGLFTSHSPTCTPQTQCVPAYTFANGFNYFINDPAESVAAAATRQIEEVPEPGSSILLLSGLVGLALVLKRREGKAA